jgi:O-6-methylguanine DNA methyltransferase
VNSLYFLNMNTPLGLILAGATNQGICHVEFEDSKNHEEVKGKLSKNLGLPISETINPHLAQLQIQLAEYFDGKRQEFKIPIVFFGTEFQQKVWGSLLKIPFGCLRTYKEQALEMNKLKGIRAVANANGLNNILILVPCHRVIGSNGKLTGYSGLLWRKKWLIHHEQSIMPLNGKLF